MTTNEPRIERKPMKAAKPPDLAFAADNTVRVTGLPDPITFASRSAFEDVATAIYQAGLQRGWAGGRLQLMQTGQIVDDKEITRDENGRITGMFSRRTVVPRPAGTPSPKAPR